MLHLLNFNYSHNQLSMMAKDYVKINQTTFYPTRDGEKYYTQHFGYKAFIRCNYTQHRHKSFIYTKVGIEFKSQGIISKVR